MAVAGIVTGDITFLISYMTSHEHVIRQLCDFICEFPLPKVIVLPSLVVVGLAKNKIFS